MIEVHQLTKRYARHEAVREISFTVERGEIVGFLGPNGAGKTTTLRMLTGLPAADLGQRARRRLRHLPPIARRPAAKSATCRKTSRSMMTCESANT